MRRADLRRSSSTPCSRWMAPSGAADLLAQNPFERHAPGKTAVTPNPELRQRRSHLAADEPHPDDHRVPARDGLVLDRIALGDRAKVMDSGQVGPRDVKPPVAAAGGDQELLIWSSCARVEDHRVRGGDRPRPRRPRRAARRRAPRYQSLVSHTSREILLGSQVRLRQRGPAEGHPGSRLISTSRP